MKDKALKRLFVFLADEDVKHRKIFEKMLSQANTDATKGAYQEERQSFLQSYADEYVFSSVNSGELMAKNIKTPGKAVEYGIDIEVESMLYYFGFRKFMGHQEKEMVDSIIDEEHSHYLKLLKVKSELKGRV